MKKLIAALLILSMLAVPAIAQSAQPTLISASSGTPGVKAYIILGAGIAASPSDPMDFMIIKFGIGRVRIGNETDIALGVLIADEEKYRLREIVIEEGHVEGDIYSAGRDVGSFEVTSVMKGDTEIWAGELNLKGAKYNMYVIEGVRPIKAGELKEKVADYCRNSTDINCRSKIHDYCMDHPDDRRCKALFRAYCLRGNNMDDTRCRQAFRNWCKDNPSNKYCVPFALQRAKKYCELHSGSRLCRKIATDVADFCSDNPDNEGCANVKQLIEERPRLLRKVQAIRDRIEAIKTAVAVNATAVSAEVTSADVGGE